MSEVELISSTGQRARWRSDELAEVVESSSGHVRFLLHELGKAESIAARELKSHPVSYAQVQRICNSRGKESLVLSRTVDGDKHYALNPEYRTVILPLVENVEPPPPSEPKPPREKKPRMGRRTKGMSALDGIADVRGSFVSAPPPPARRISQTQSGRTLSIPADIPIEFCKELMGFLNSTGGGTRFRIVLEENGYRLEAC
jgi:hypothetical protein